MELYYKDLISEEASLEKLVDDLMLAVQGVTAAGAQLDPDRKRELLTRLERVKQTCLHLRTQAVHTARATDKMLRRFPYSSIGLAFLGGLVLGLAVKHERGGARVPIQDR